MDWNEIKTWRFEFIMSKIGSTCLNCDQGCFLSEYPKKCLGFVKHSEDS